MTIPRASGGTPKPARNCAKIGLVTGHGLARVLRERYPRTVYPAVIALVVANTQNAGVIIAATLVGMVIAILEINPIAALVRSAVINGLVAAPLLVLVMLVSNNRAAMGEWTNGRLVNVVVWLTTIVMGVAAIALVVTSILG